MPSLINEGGNVSTINPALNQIPKVAKWLRGHNFQYRADNSTIDVEAFPRERDYSHLWIIAKLLPREEFPIA